VVVAVIGLMMVLGSDKSTVQFSIPSLRQSRLCTTAFQLSMPDGEMSESRPSKKDGLKESPDVGIL